jgi:cell division protein FtsZ
VNQPVEFVPVTEVVDRGIIKYSLEEYMEVDDDFKSSKPVAKAPQEVVPAELNITMKKVDAATASSRLEEISHGNDNRRNVEA